MFDDAARRVLLLRLIIKTRKPALGGLARRERALLEDQNERDVRLALAAQVSGSQTSELIASPSPDASPDASPEASPAAGAVNGSPGKSTAARTERR